MRLLRHRDRSLLGDGDSAVGCDVIVPRLHVSYVRHYDSQASVHELCEGQLLSLSSLLSLLLLVLCLNTYV